ncbi:hypothetical protein DPX39_030041200 [Trypanosoma brucei equiperdum]|uniref:Uncharacterized protein n=1 Tax=Trypanosoma brucei equiperdum TaxID=630700 RepID=A0A3L6LB61_9TRYP|nr:hypothetical protein DPX39_030041200 [Trypanosoma brucei equiperdum]
MPAEGSNPREVTSDASVSQQEENLVTDQGGSAKQEREVMTPNNDIHYMSVGVLARGVADPSYSHVVSSDVSYKSSTALSYPEESLSPSCASFGEAGDDSPTDAEHQMGASPCNSIIGSIDMAAAINVLRSRLGTTHKKVMSVGSPLYRRDGKGGCSCKSPRASSPGSMTSRTLKASITHNQKASAASSIADNGSPSAMASQTRRPLKGCQPRSPSRREVVMIREDSNVRFGVDDERECHGDDVNEDVPRLVLTRESLESMGGKSNIRVSSPLPPRDASEHGSPRKCIMIRSTASPTNEKVHTPVSKVPPFKGSWASSPKASMEKKGPNTSVLLPTQAAPISIPCVGTGLGNCQLRGNGLWGNDTNAVLLGERTTNVGTFASSPLPRALPEPRKAVPSLTKDRNGNASL